MSTHLKREEIWIYNGAICEVYSLQANFNQWTTGYVTIPNFWMPQEHAEDMINVHGGVTFCESNGNYFTIGFDTNHVGDGQWTIDKTKQETEKMAIQILNIKENKTNVKPQPLKKIHTELYSPETRTVDIWVVDEKTEKFVESECNEFGILICINKQERRYHLLVTPLYDIQEVMNYLESYNESEDE